MDRIIKHAKEIVETIPEGTLKRNSHYYELLTYFNHTVAFYSLGKYDESIIFLIRGIKLCENLLNEGQHEFVLGIKKFFNLTLSILKEEKRISNQSLELIQHSLS